MIELGINISIVTPLKNKSGVEIDTLTVLDPKSLLDIEHRNRATFLRILDNSISKLESAMSNVDSIKQIFTKGNAITEIYKLMKFVPDIRDEAHNNIMLFGLNTILNIFRDTQRQVNTSSRYSIGTGTAFFDLRSIANNSEQLP